MELQDDPSMDSINVEPSATKLSENEENEEASQASVIEPPPKEDKELAPKEVVDMEEICIYESGDPPQKSDETKETAALESAAGASKITKRRGNKKLDFNQIFREILPRKSKNKAKELIWKSSHSNLKQKKGVRKSRAPRRKPQPSKGSRPAGVKKRKNRPRFNRKKKGTRRVASETSVTTEDSVTDSASMMSGLCKRCAMEL